MKIFMTIILENISQRQRDRYKIAKKKLFWELFWPPNYKAKISFWYIPAWRFFGVTYSFPYIVFSGVGKQLGMLLYVFGPETHMTAIRATAMGKRPIPDQEAQEFSTANFLLLSGKDEGPTSTTSSKETNSLIDQPKQISNDTTDSSSVKHLFNGKTKTIIKGMQTRAIQSMLDFNFVYRRAEPSVAVLVYPFTGQLKQKFYCGHKKVLTSS